MSTRDISYGVRLEADARGFVGQQKVAEQSVTQFGQAAQKASNDTAAAYARLDASLQKQIDLRNLEREAGRKLTEGERMHLDIVSQVRAGTLQLSEAQQMAIRQKVESIKAIDEETRANQRFAIAMAAAVTVIGTLVYAASVAWSTVKKAVGVVDDLDERAQAFGSTAIELSKYEASALRAGFSTQQLGQAFVFLSNKMVDAERGSQQSQALFAALGVDIYDATGKLRSATAVMGDVADKFRGFAEGPEKTALAFELLGRVGPKGIAWLSQGSEGLQQFSGLTDEAARESLRLQSELDKLAASSQQFAYKIMGLVVPALNEWIAKARGVDEATNIRALTIEIERLEKFNAQAIASANGNWFQRMFGGNYDLAIKRNTDRLRELRAELDKLLTAAVRGQLDQFKNDYRDPAPVVPKVTKEAKAKIEGPFTEEELRTLREYGALLSEQDKQRQALYQTTAAQLEQQRREIATMQEGNQKLREHNEEIGLSAQEVARLRDTRMDAAIAQKEEALATAEAIGGQEAAIATMRKEIELLKERQRLLRQGAAREASAEASRAAVEEAKRMSQEIERELTDALMRGFESGKSFAQNLRDTLWNLFRTLVLRPIIAPIAQTGANELSGLGQMLRGWLGSFSGPSQGDYDQLGVGLMQPSSAAAGPRVSGAAGAGNGGLQVQVHNYGGAQVDTQLKRGPGGGLTLEVLIDRAADKIAGDITRGRGSLGRSLEQVYGLQRKPA